MSLKVAVITISDRAHAGEYVDLAGPALRELCISYQWHIQTELLVPDDILAIQKAILASIHQGNGLIITTGGTGIAPRDQTPEAIRALMKVELPGFGEVMRMKSFESVPNAILSRSLAAVVENALVIALPGKPKAATECLHFVKDAIPHAVLLAERKPTSC